MYSDPSLIRENVVKLRLNDREHDLLRAWANYTGQQPAVLFREMLLEQARLEFAAELQSSEGPQRALFGN
jgi:hypothetical protein